MVGRKYYLDIDVSEVNHTKATNVGQSPDFVYRCHLM